MAILRCSCLLVGKKKDKGGKGSSKASHNKKDCIKTLQVSLKHPVISSENDEFKETSFSVPVPFSLTGNARCKVKVMSLESPVQAELEEEAAYEGEDEQDENQSFKRAFSNSDLPRYVGKPSEEDESVNRIVNADNSFDTELNDQSGHISDPGVGKTRFWASPKLKRSCSSLETRNILKKIAQPLPPSNSQSFEDLQRLGEKLGEEIGVGNPGSPLSVRTHCSADKVMLKKHSSSQILPSRSRRLWWKLFLWSHRNLHDPWNASKKSPDTLATINQQGGYSSDTLEPNRGMGLHKLESSRIFSGESLNRESQNNDNQSWDGFHGVSGLWPQNQWVAFPGESSSSLTRVDEWVKEVATAPLTPIDDENLEENGISFPLSPERSRPHSARNLNLNLSEEILHANNVIHSLNSSSTVAHISSMGLKVVPSLSHFSSLRSVNLSGNYIGK